MTDVNTAEMQLKWCLRLLGAIDLLAIVAIVMPRETMMHIHAATGLGQFPEGAIVGYLARSASAMYALHGALIVYLSFDVRHHAGVIRFLACAAFAHGAVIIGIDWNENMPDWWRIAEGPCYAATGLVVLLFQNRFRRACDASTRG